MLHDALVSCAAEAVLLQGRSTQLCVCGEGYAVCCVAAFILLLFFVLCCHCRRRCTARSRCQAWRACWCHP